ncbi:MAG: tyrosine-protein phosphatase [Desulfobacteraceae bacterium]|nr:tyrosine-protein phosphatase [Desulfobacteraceae bacterium]MBL7102223.1 tyrosine-protein phosphatase [Desulfobacteraceae bacterium]MBL7172544.1 tyrosine-protein phosphatase [Desulfobacteraceae bacterium]MBU0736251.1 tyrosine-protein phosphatase [Pseudomonadota bacterium]MBU0989651.1 tyrosine-protein phosphatase [Pseudomonadota bacterium]
MDKNKRSSVISDITVERLDNRSVRIGWKTGRRDLGVSIHYGTSPTGSGVPSGHVIRVTGMNCAEVSGLDPSLRYYFRVVPDGEKGTGIADRQVHLEGAVNFRDLGGYRTSDGRRVRWGQVFRSDSLARLTDRDRTRLRHLGLRLIIDFRTPNEVKKSPDRLPQSSTIRYLNLPITHGEFDFVGAVERIKKGDDSWLTEDFMVSGYIHNLDEFAHVWGEVIRRLIVPGNRPLLFHCTGGKDRAGTCAALILLALGVPEETVIDDHQLSNILIADLVKEAYKRIASYGVDPQKLSPYFTAPMECIISFLEHLRQTYGSPADYLKTAAGLSEETLALLKEELLE